MSYDVRNVINIVTRISPAGLAFANFGKAMLFAPLLEAPVGFDFDTYRTYNSLADLAVDFDDTTETYEAALNWFGTIPAPRELNVWVRNDPTDSVVATLTTAADTVWWYWTFFTEDVYAAESDVIAAVAWGDANTRFTPNCSIAADIRDPGDDTDIASQLTTLGNRRAYTLSHATDKYAGISLAAQFAAILFTGTNTTITGEFKKLTGVAAEDLTGTEYAAMKQPTKKAVFYTQIDLQGSTDSGRVINSYTHSSFGEYIDDVFNLDAFVNDLQVTAYNAVANQVTKLGQTPPGQDVINASGRETGERYISNGYLGPRNYIDPDDGLEKFTLGYEILTKPEDILSISESERNDRKSAPLRIRIYRAGAIHAVDITVDVY